VGPPRPVFLGRCGSRGRNRGYRRQCSGRRTLLLSVISLLWAVSLPAVSSRLEWLRLGTQLLLNRKLPSNAVEQQLAMGLTPDVIVSRHARCLRSGGLRCELLLSGLWLIACGAPAHSEPDMFMRTVGFALTGSDDAVPKVIGDRANCVFAINNEIFRLNNIHADHITIKGSNRQRPWGSEQWVTVFLPGDDVVFEETIEPAAR